MPKGVSTLQVRCCEVFIASNSQQAELLNELKGRHLKNINDQNIEEMAAEKNVKHHITKSIDEIVKR